MVLLDLLSRRWALRVIWELRDQARTARALRTACEEASPTVLQARLKELREAGFVERGEGGYRLTNLGRRLLERVTPLNRLAKSWAKKVDRA